MPPSLERGLVVKIVDAHWHVLAVEFSEKSGKRRIARLCTFMRSLSKLLSHLLLKTIVLPTAIGAVLFVSGCSDKAGHSAAAKVAPAKVELVPHETELSTLKLSSEAVKRLAIEVVPVEKHEVSRHRTLAGEALVPPGRSIITAAPVPGVIVAADKFFPQPGIEVSAAQPLMILKPLLSPERDVPTPAEQVQMTGAKANLMVALVTAQGEVARSQSEIEGLQIARDRAAKLLSDRAGSRRALDDAEALLGVARSVLEAAKQREKELVELLESSARPAKRDESIPRHR